MKGSSAKRAFLGECKRLIGAVVEPVRVQSPRISERVSTLGGEILASMHSSGCLRSLKSDTNALCGSPASLNLAMILANIVALGHGTVFVSLSSISSR